MAYHSIVVSLNAFERAEALMEAANVVARAHEAHVSGVYVIPSVEIYPVFAMQVTPQIIDSQREYYLEQAAKVKAVFEKTARREGLSYEWHQDDARSATIADVVVNYGRRTDLMIAGQMGKRTGYIGDSVLAERLLMESGRPVLFIPDEGRFTAFGNSVLVAWNGSQEATRATFDALPFLQKASNVQILAIDPTGDEERKPMITGANIAETLKRHGVEVELHQTNAKEMSVGDTIFAWARDRGADLLVMGGYGHSRMREFIFGGVTKKVLKNMNLPVLMSH